jgi:hypothetical protein
VSNIRIVEIPFERIQCNNWQSTWKASEYGIDLVHWLKKQGLVMYKDFEWRVDITNTLLEFRFYETAGYIPTMFALKFAGGNK